MIKIFSFLKTVELQNELTVALSAFVAWSVLNPMDMIIPSDSALAVKLEDFCEPGSCSGIAKSETGRETMA